MKKITISIAIDDPLPDQEVARILTQLATHPNWVYAITPAVIKLFDGGGNTIGAVTVQ